MSNTGRITRSLLTVALVLLLVVLGWSVFALPMQMPGLQTVVAEHVPQSGVAHPVTAVLLNFRGYDTFLELCVLLLILVGVWSLGKGTRLPAETRAADPVLYESTRILVPLLILVGGYLLWVGASAPGGAFQAGAILAAGGVLLILSGRSPPRSTRTLALLLVTLGVLVFIVAGTGTLLLGGFFLQYPANRASQLILLIETAATLSIGTTLAALFVGAKPSTWEESPDRKKAGK